ALQRVAHLLCEQLARRETVGINDATIPLTQIDLADAAGLSIVHVNRTFQELRRLKILSKEGRAIQALTKHHPSSPPPFSPLYLNMPRLLPHRQVNIELASRPPARLPATIHPLASEKSKVGVRLDRVMRGLVNAHIIPSQSAADHSN